MARGGKREGAGQPPHNPTDKQRSTVQVLKANGNSHRVISQIIGVDEKTLMKHYRKELDEGFETVRGLVGAAVVRSALSGNVNAQRYWLACFGEAHWKPPKDTEAIGGGSDGKTTIVVRGGIASVTHESSSDSSTN